MKEPLIVQIAKEKYNYIKNKPINMVEDNSANNLISDIANYPHAFVLGCLMDRQIKAERAWKIPLLVKNEIKSFDMDTLTKVPLNEFRKIFEKGKFHRFGPTMSEIFYDGVQDIHFKYDNNASKIWEGKPSSSSVVYKFLEFKGCGIKIATMATNILGREFKIEFSDLYSIDISPDVHVVRVMKRMGLVPKNAKPEMIIYKAREINPEFPGILDLSVWEIGNNWCKSSKPNCKNCSITSECKKII